MGVEWIGLEGVGAPESSDVIRRDGRHTAYLELNSEPLASELNF